MSEQKLKWNKWKRWAVIVPLAVWLVWTVLYSEIDLNKPLEYYMTPVVSEEEAKEIIATQKTDPEHRPFRYVVQQAIAKDPVALRVLASAYRYERGPLFSNKCRAMDYYMEAGRLGDLEASDEVAVMMVNHRGGYKNIELGYLWAIYALHYGYERSRITIEVYFKDELSEKRRKELNKLVPGWEPPDLSFLQDNEWPVIPVFTKILKQFVPVRYCQKPWVVDFIRYWLGLT